MIGALSLDGMGPMMTTVGATTGDIFLAYITQHLIPVLKPGDIVVLDNLGAHRDKRVKNAVEAAGAILKFQPAYSPDLNPIELAWGHIKTFLKTAKARSIDALNNAIAMAMDLINPEGHAPAWFRHSGWPEGQQH